MAKTVALNEFGKRIGESHSNAKYTDSEVHTVLGLHGEGYGYKRISKMMDMPIRTVRCIAKGARRCQTPVTYKEVEE